MRVVRVVVYCCLLWVLPGVAFSQQPDQLESLLASAHEAQARSDFQAAADFYLRATVLHPEIAELQANLGLMYYQTGKDGAAIEAFRKALRLKPGLFVPNLFLGLESVKAKRFTEAIGYFKQAALVNPNEVQVQLGLGQAYAGKGENRLAIIAYSRAAQLDPANADTWYHLGVRYLEQVEADARILISLHRDSSYVQALMAETFAEQRAFIQADETYKDLVSRSKLPPGVHAGYGFLLLNRHDLAGADRELNAELVSNPGSLLAKLGMARLHLEQGSSGQAAEEIAEISAADPGFLGANISQFTAGLPPPKREELERALEQQEAAGNLPRDFADLFRNPAAGGGTRDSLPAVPAKGEREPNAVDRNATKLYSKGNYGECSDALIRQQQQLPAKSLELLANCSYFTGNYPVALSAAARLASNPTTEVAGLYWETKSAQKLATQALARASATDSNSPKLHVLLGDVYRQQKSFPDAEQEYRKALALRPDDAGALFGLSLSLLTDGQNDEAQAVAQAVLEKDPEDPEFNALMGEILCARHDFSAAEPFLKKSLGAKPELLSRVHALLGNVYAKTNRTQEAIAELKLALASDKDGTLHYQIARLYLRVGDRDAAKQAFETSKQIQQQGLRHASVAMEQGADAESQ